MKHAKTLLIATILASPSLQAQITDVLNNDIYVEFGVANDQYIGANDFDNSSDPTIRTDVYMNGAWMNNWGCHWWEGTSPTYSQSNGGYWAAQTPFTGQWGTRMEAWESDGSDNCSYSSFSDDDYFSGDGILYNSVTLGPILRENSIFRPCQWITDLGTGNNTPWLYTNYQNSGTSQFNEAMRMTWRYVSGAEPGNPLSFGDISGVTKSDINSNRPVATVSGLPLQYTSAFGEASAEVWYGFNLTQSSTIIISTNHAETDFDTRIDLWNTGGLIMQDDNSGPNNTSIITMQLCPGYHAVMVEGTGSSTGVFKLSVTAVPVTPLSIWVVSNPGVSCAGANDGVVSWSSAGGLGAVGYAVNGTNVGASTTLGGFWVGTHTVLVGDACGSVATVTFPVGNGDVTPPVALCNATLPINVFSGQDTPVIVEDVDNGSSDNCNGLLSMSVEPDTLSSANVGANTVTLYVTDDNGNTSTCTSTAVVSIIDGPCIPTSTYGTTEGDFIDGVVVEGISNTGSGGPSGGTYNDYTDQFSTDLERGADHNMTITSGDYSPDNFAAWIDYDRNDVFDASEKLGEFTNASVGESQAIGFTVPAGTSLGATIMRVRGVYFDVGEPTPADPCFGYKYGETEDYGINIIEGMDVEEHDFALLQVYPNPTKGIVNVGIHSALLGDRTTIEVTDMLGRVITSAPAINGVQRIDLSGQAEGCYVVKVKNGAQMIARRITLQ